MSPARGRYAEQIVPRSLRQLIEEEPDQLDQAAETARRRRRTRRNRMVRKRR